MSRLLSTIKSWVVMSLSIWWKVLLMSLLWLTPQMLKYSLISSTLGQYIFEIFWITSIPNLGKHSFVEQDYTLSMSEQVEIHILNLHLTVYQGIFYVIFSDLLDQQLCVYDWDQGNWWVFRNVKKWMSLVRFPLLQMMLLCTFTLFTIAFNKQTLNKLELNLSQSLFLQILTRNEIYSRKFIIYW